ncbi:hypothetical protein CHGG_06243 [Chaetomium globosum CBS 148.51]|uniref:Uncharacterized protein n=1 Tax=Chaetomium globosum (strain ATCC 6205 / CBS 148.51 / DSM 1962 / NBRC 6347 / NRRL 1970) TaxID=306901 RepID=Q2H522_CHAGB|nr:uncharacterized protein CHGG_06243 [Chaetomium globosum CBS 148.51]EAQ89624.1 hypothetical protein CHGG_06243 [Chaetomium globosum CBS 148.51]
MADEPALPTLPPSLPVDARRKRRRITNSPHTQSSASSDPAFFSSDDDPALDNYNHNGRRKKRYVGTWFDQQPASSDSAVGEEPLPRYPPPRRNGPPQPQKREFRRQLDSGVWMGAEDSITDTDDSFEIEPAAPKFPVASPRARGSMSAPSTVSREELEAQWVVSGCVEGGTEQVDLSSLNLDFISPEVVKLISDISPIPNVSRDVAFEQRDPEIQLFLSMNRLRSFPSGILTIEHLALLSLRANNLDEIPPAVGRLTKLEALNLGQNFIRVFPAELLNLLRPGSKLRSLSFQPNRFWQPDTANATAAAISTTTTRSDEYDNLTYPKRSTTKVESSWSGVTTKLHSRSPVQFMTGTGQTLSRFSLPDLPGARGALIELEPLTSLATPKEFTTEQRKLALSTSKVYNPKGARSLFELALRAGIKSSQVEEVRSWALYADEAPPHFSFAVEQAVKIHRDGGVSFHGLTCS